MTNHYFFHLVKEQRIICRKGCLLKQEFHGRYKGSNTNEQKCTSEHFAYSLTMQRYRIKAKLQSAQQN